MESGTEFPRMLSSRSVATRSREIVQSERLISILRDTDSSSCRGYSAPSSDWRQLRGDTNARSLFVPPPSPVSFGE